MKGATAILDVYHDRGLTADDRPGQLQATIDFLLDALGLFRWDITDEEHLLIGWHALTLTPAQIDAWAAVYRRAVDKAATR